MKKRTNRRLSLLLLLAMLAGQFSIGAQPALAADIHLQSGSDGSFCQMPVSGVDTLDVSNMDPGFSFTVYDNGGAGAYYSDGCNGTLLITAPANCLLGISASGSTESGADFLCLYDGDTAEPFETRSGEIVLSGLCTSANVLKVNFYSDGSVTFDGFALTVTLLDRSQFLAVTYAYNGSSSTTTVGKGTAITLPTFTSLFTLPERYHFDHWQSGESSYAEGDSYTVNADVTFTAVLTEDPVIVEDETYGRYVNLPKTGALTADLSEWQEGDVLWVFDNGGANGYYSYSCDGSVTVIAPEGTQLYLDVSGRSEERGDWLYIYDGDPTSAALLGQYSDYISVSALTTSGNTATIRFTSNQRSNYTGFSMKVRIFVPSSLVTLSFDPGAGSGAMDSITRLPGDRISLPICRFTCPDHTEFDYYTDGVNHYSEYGVYVFGDTDATLTAVYADTVVFTYENGLEAPITKICRKGSSPALKNYSSLTDPMFRKTPYRKTFRAWLIDGAEYQPGYRYPASADTTVTAVFNELPILQDDGSGGLYILMPTEEDVDCSLADRANGFTFRFYDDGGADGFCAYSCNGSMTLRAPENFVFAVSGSVETKSDIGILSLFDSDGTTLLGGGAFTGSCTVDELTTSGNTLKLAFENNNGNLSEGFALTIWIYDPATLRTLRLAPGAGSGAMEDIVFLAGQPLTLPACGFTAPNGMLFSAWSDGATTWQAGETVVWGESKTLTALWAEATSVTYAYGDSAQTVQAPLGAALTLPAFTDFFTLPDKMQFAGWREQESGAVYQAGASCVLNGATRFDAVLEPIPVVRQDEYGVWYALMPHFSGAALSEDTAVLSGKDFQFHVYDDGGKDGYYGKSFTSVLTVVAPLGCALQVSGSGETESKYDYLYFYDGQTVQSPKLSETKYSGDFSVSPALTTTGRYLTIQFYSDESIVKSGFDLLVSVVSTAPHAIITLDGGGAALLGGIENPFTLELGTQLELPHGGMVFEIPAGKVFGGWRIDGVLYDIGAVYTVSKDVTAAAVWVDPSLPWDILGAQLAAASGENLGTIVLTSDLTGSANSRPLTVPAGVTATIDLAGHTIDGTATAAVWDGVMLDVRGGLTFIDSVGGGAVTGGALQVLGSGAFTAPAGYPAGAELWYRPRDDSDMRRAVAVYYPTAREAVTRAWDVGELWEVALPAHVASETYAVLLSDAAIPAGETWTVDTGDTWINLDLNGHRFDVQGALDGGGQIYIDSSAAGVFSSCGTIEATLNLYSADTCRFTGGELDGDFTARDGVVLISGGAFEGEVSLSDCVCTVTGGVFADAFTFNGGVCDIAGGVFSEEVTAYGGTLGVSGGRFLNWLSFDNWHNPVVTISDEAYVSGLWLEVDPEIDSAESSLTVSGSARIGELQSNVSGNGTAVKPRVRLCGGYYGENPENWVTAHAAAAQITLDAPVEAYSGQANWIRVDESEFDCPWRIRQAETALVLPAALKTIGESAFENCGAAEVYVPNGCTAIGRNAFKDCKSLRTIHIPASVTSIDDTAFAGCGTLRVWGVRGSKAETFCDKYAALIFCEESGGE